MASDRIPHVPHTDSQGSSLGDSILTHPVLHDSAPYAPSSGGGSSSSTIRGGGDGSRNSSSSVNNSSSGGVSVSNLTHGVGYYLSLSAAATEHTGVHAVSSSYDSSNNNNNVVNSSNRTFSNFLSVIEHGAASVYSSSSSSSVVEEQKGPGRLLTSADNEFYNNHNNNRIQFDNDIGGYLNISASDIDFFSQQLFSQIEFRMGDELTRYVCPVIIILGNISNFVAFLVLRRNKFKSSSTAFYMSAYALANLCFLDLMLGIAWFCFVLEIKYLAHHADWSCRLWTFISNVITYSGIWFVVVMAIDRFVFVNLHSKASGYCRVFTAKGITTFVIICLIVVSIHAMWTFELQPQGCWVSYHQDDLHTSTWPWWSATLYSYIPLLLLLMLIIAQSVTYCIRRFRKHLPADGAQTGSQETFVVSVFVITVAFFFFTVPSTVINLLDIHLPSHLLKVDVIAKIELTKKITELLSSLNNSLLGIVLFVCSPTYRIELMCLCRHLFCNARSRTLKVFEMRAMSQSEDSSPHIQVDYELCNNNEENVVTDV